MADQGFEFFDRDLAVAIDIEDREGRICVGDLDAAADQSGVEFGSGDQEVAIGIGGGDHPFDRLIIDLQSERTDSGDYVLDRHQTVAVPVPELERIDRLSTHCPTAFVALSTAPTVRI